MSESDAPTISLPFALPASVAKAVKSAQSSLTLQGGAVAGAATFVAAKGAPLLIALGIAAGTANELVGDLAGLMGAAGVLMVFVGRLRLGDLK